MIKTLRRTIKQDKERSAIPKSVQQAIPIRAIWPDGIFAIGNKFSKSFRFADINYAVASREDKETMFLSYSELLNSFDSGATTKITIHNRRLHQADVERSVFIPLRDDELDMYRQEYNDMLLGKATDGNSNGTVQDKYITISVAKKNVDEARHYFARVGTELTAHFSRLGSKCTELDATDRLRILHDFFRIGEEADFRFDMQEMMRKGHDFKDYICPDTFEFAKDHFRMGNSYGRVIFLRDYASYIKDSMVAELCDLNRNLLLSLDVIPIPTDEAVREVENRLLGVETNITNWQRRQNRNNNFSAVVPYDMEQQRKESKEFLSDLTTRDQRMMFGLLTMVHVADSKEQLDNDTETLLTTARKHLCQFATLSYQQMDGLNTVLPYGLRKVHALRTLTTESTAVFIPFRAQEIMHTDGIYYGQNVISKNMIVANRKQLLNGNSFILGVSGSGKSFTAKREIVNQILASDDDVILIDPEREYSALVSALGGETVHISATSTNHINAMDMNRDYGDGANPIILKSEFVLSLCEQLIGGHQLGAKEKSLIDRCTAAVYRKYLQSNYKGQPPTLQDFRAELLKQAEPEAQDIALAIELFTSGSLNTFAKPTNVNVHNRLICYDILDLGKQLLPIGMLVVLDNILNRITQNRARGKNTFIFIDEIYLLFQHEYSANFLFTLWKRVRKYGAFCTGITQNVDDLLQSHTARTMLANSEFIVMLNQASTDRMELAELLNISDLQLSYITNVDAGNGLMKVGSSLVPFTDKFPRHTKLYSLMTTKPGE
ncbi:Type IV secretory pathway, VirB4 component [Paenibacillus sp. RU4T]|uniref:VirB4-like conjugal transfer ATPase, CD1110 family n=1 Tax=unclassified Paenibacillus TaxID=185978 RepID=UPI000953A1BA|nr:MULTISPECIES: ATP-binding protein [unclassified Paenibacillus]SIR50311.1 Type IV secretory pathway, VirB4 component [Paenibacillus sp. RU4X]SIR59378.1 Type IV secretory pathway, VirB4 component [Paenibacillus sp. RU4T]